MLISPYEPSIEYGTKPKQYKLSHAIRKVCELHPNLA
jgi:hypothetical protein